MLRLLDKVAVQWPGCNLIFGGDLIDRGIHSRQVVEYAMAHRIPTVCGNHENLALFHHKRIDSAIYGEPHIWLLNGGIDALKSWGQEPDGKLPSKVLDWMAALPYYLEFDEGKLLVSHTGHGKAKKARKGLFGEEEPLDMLLWYRDTHFEDDGAFRVFDHTQEAEPVITDTYAMIDTGAAYSGRGYGTMTAFHWPTKQVIQQDYDESPLETS